VKKKFVNSKSRFIFAPSNKYKQTKNKTMKTTYFKTEKAFDNYLNDLQQEEGIMIIRGSVGCAGGETRGAHVFSKQSGIVETVYLDEFEFDNASNFDKGE
jgi:hypothetical protein